MPNFSQDVRFAARTLLRTPRFTVPAVLALALGIGATSAIFSIVRGVMLKSLPYSDPDRVVAVWETNAGRNRSRNVIAPANFVAWRERNRSVAHLGMVGPTRITLRLDGTPEEVTGFSASSDVFLALGVQPALGRAYTAGEDLDGNDAVIVISHEFWQARLGGRRDVLGLSLRTDGRPRTVVGVMPPEFTIEGARTPFMIPYGWTLERLRAAPGRGSSHAIARLRDGVSLVQASEEMQRIAAQLEKEAPRRNTGWSVALVPIHEQTVDAIRPALLVLSGAVALVLLVACVNVANLLLARGTVRRRELGVRSALGAGRMRLVRQMLTESLVLAAVAGAAGLALAAAFHRGLLALVADRIPVPRLDQVALDLPVVAFTMLVALGTGVLFGVVPALLTTSAAQDALREGGRHGGGSRSRQALGALVVVEIALSLVLLAGAGVLIRSFVRLQNVDPGFRAEGVLTGRVTLSDTGYPDDASVSRFVDTVVARLSAAPGVDRAAAVTFLPMSGPGIATSFYRLGRPAPADGEAPTADVRPVTPGFFRTMGIPHVAGRDIAPSDVAGAPLVAVVSRELVRSQFPGEDPLGKHLFVSIGPPPGMHVQIVGVVGDIKMATLDTGTRPAVYLPHPQLPIGFVTLVVRTGVEPTAFAATLSRVVQEVDPELPVADVRTMRSVVDETLARPRTVSVLLSVFALIALVLAAVGVYGVMAYSVSQRTQEIGLRMALGATERSVFGLVLSQAMELVALGVVIGLGAAALFAQVLESMLFETPPVDAWTFAATAVVLMAVAAVASYVPARRGMRIAPVEALRAE
jgi:putative ABC transport system permease protein